MDEGAVGLGTDLSRTLANLAPLALAAALNGCHLRLGASGTELAARLSFGTLRHTSLLLGGLLRRRC